MVVAVVVGGVEAAAPVTDSGAVAAASCTAPFSDFWAWLTAFMSTVRSLEDMSISAPITVYLLYTPIYYQIPPQ